MRHHHHPVADSTNELAKRFWHVEHPDNPVLFSADAQTQGKGTQGRVWSSPAGCGLYVTLLYPAAQSPWGAAYPWTPAVGIITLEWLQQFHGSKAFPVHLKPVNDLMVGSRKLGGILVEAIHQASQPQAWIIGVGINLTPPPEMPHDYPERAISLSDIFSLSIERSPATLAESLGKTLCQKLPVLDAAQVMPHYQQLCGIECN